MQLLKNLSIRGKLFLISIIPSFGLLIFLYSSISESLEEKSETLEVQDAVNEVDHLSSLLREFQMERAAVMTYMATNDASDERALSRQMVRTNRTLEAVHAVMQSHNLDAGRIIQIDSLDLLREDLRSYPDELNILKSRTLSAITNTVSQVQAPAIRELLDAHMFLLHADEYFFRSRNTLLPFFIKKTLDSGQFVALATERARYSNSVELFMAMAPAELQQEAAEFYTSQTIDSARMLFHAFLADPSSVVHVDARDWVSITNKVIDAHLRLQEKSLQGIMKTAAANVDQINRVVLMNVAGGLILLLIVATLVAFAVRHMVVAISELKRAAQKLALGEVNFTVGFKSRDELGELAESFDRIVTVKRQYAETAEKIGKGHYDTPVLARSKDDILGIALTNMRNDLERLSNENSVRTWLLTSSGQLNDSMRGEKDLDVLANDVITQLAEILNAQIGALYVKHNGLLRLVGRYAFSSFEKNDLIAFGPREGLVGQAAAEGKHMVITNVPEDYVKVRSGIGDSKPSSLVVYPFKYEDEICGVVELGANKEFSDLDLEFLEMVSPHIAIAINASQSRQRLKELVEETQRQAEELEAQQEELKQFNEELLEKTHMLEKSEEELKAQQEELQMSNEELIENTALLQEQKQNLEFTKLQLEAKAQELEQASKYKSEFLSNMSHELRTPLNSILILAQVLMENRNQTLTPKEIKFANTIYNSGNDLLNLISEILDLSKIEAGKMELDVSPFSLDVIVQNIKNGFDELARSKKIKFSVSCTKQLAQKVMVSDSQRIEQVLKNFLSNSFKFTPNGGKIDLLIEPAPTDAGFKRKSLQQTKDVIGFTVRDTGIGIPEDKLNVIFEAFQQVDGSTKRKYGGTGLGLSISRELTNLLGGEIQVASQVGSGSTFTLYLPAEISSAERSDEATLTIRPSDIVPDDPDDSTSASPLTDASHYDDQHLLTEGDRKILIMEDDVEFAKVLLDFVHERNYKGIIAHQGNIGLSYARHYKPDAIILDMKLPVIDGAEVLRKLKIDPELRHIPVQIISGYDYRKSGLELGAIDFIRKPISKEAFWKALDKVENFVSRKPKKLLIIEDDAEQNSAVKELIGNGDVKCYSAFSGKEGYEMLKKTTFDCVIVDLGLPDMNGLKFLEMIREDSDINSIPVIVYTGKDLSKEENAQLEKLADTVVLKTAFSHERLLDETTLFLHRVETKLPKEKQIIIRKLHKTDEVLKGKTVLIADDDDRNVYSLISALEPEGMKCLTATNGKIAIDLIKEQSTPIDIILMDVMMPEMDGLEATRLIRSIGNYRKVPIIALTAKAMKDDREKCLAAGMSDYISKPLNVQQLLSLMRVWLYG
jgi:CheY-like chemotaxis protein